MKKMIYGIAFLALLGSGLMSCEKESIELNESSATELINQEQEGIYSNGKFLVFSTFEDFETVVQMPTPEIENEFLNKVSKMKHVSYEKASEKSKVNLVEDAYLAKILNKDLAVQIGSWIYKINKPKEKVYALAVANASEYKDLIAENTSNSNILEFSTEDNVLELLEVGSDVGEKAILRNCQTSATSSTGWVEYADWVDTNGIYGTVGRRYKFKRKMRVRYDNWGIYRKLFAEFEHKESFGGTWDETYFSMQVYGKYTVRRGGSGNFSLYPAFQIYGTPLMNDTNTYFYDFNDDRKELQIYRGTRCLEKFELRGWSVFRNRATRTPNLAPNDGVGVYIEGN